MRFRDRQAIEQNIERELAKRKAELEASREHSITLDFMRRHEHRVVNPALFATAIASPGDFMIHRLAEPEHAPAQGFQRVVGAAYRDLVIARADEPAPEGAVESTPLSEALAQGRAHASRLQQAAGRSRFAGIATR
jgi:hypothetical protein